MVPLTVGAKLVLGSADGILLEGGALHLPADSVAIATLDGGC